MAETIARITMQPLAYRVADAAKALGIGRSYLFEMIRDGKLRARKLGGATIIMHSELERLLHETEETDATKRAQASMR